MFGLSEAGLGLSHLALDACTPDVCTRASRSRHLEYRQWRETDIYKVHSLRVLTASKNSFCNMYTFVYILMNSTFYKTKQIKSFRDIMSSNNDSR